MLLTRNSRSETRWTTQALPRPRRMVARARRGAPRLLAFVIALLVAHVAPAQTRQVPVESLTYDLKNPDPVRRREAAALIGQNKVQSATPNLVAAVQDGDPSVRRAISIALQQVQDPRALPGFVALAADIEKDIRERAIEGMTTAYLPRETGLVVTLNKVATFFNPWSDEWGDVMTEPGLTADPTVIQALELRLADPEPSLRAKAARSLGILRGRTTIPALLVVLREDRSNNARFEAARALRKIGDPSVGDELLKLVTYTDPKVRNEVVFALGRLRYAPAVPELGRLYVRESAVPPKQIDRAFRERLLGALAFIGDSSSKDLFLREKNAPDLTLALHANEGLARIADQGTLVEISRDRQQQKDPRILTAQAWALYRMGRKEFLTSVVDALAARRTNDDAKQYLLESRPDQVPDLFAYVSHADPNVREALAEIFGLLGDARAVPALRDLTRDQSGQVATFASQALQRINRRSGS
jgi:HEAT repeat protein